MRLFTAILLPDDVRRHLADVAAGMKRLWDAAPGNRWPAVSWTRESNLHVTLKFLGEVPDDRVPGICDALSNVETPSSPLRLFAEHLDAFRSHGSIRVLHARVAGDAEPLAALHASIEAQCAAIGFDRENRQYRAHVTLGRPRVPLRGAWDALEQSTAGKWPGPPFEAAGFALVQSRLNPAGAVYSTVATFPKNE